MAPRLLLDLHPIVPRRAPDGHQWLGYRLRLPDGGEIVAGDDPLLLAFGAMTTTVFVRDEHLEALQERCFDPGRELLLDLEAFDPEDPDLVTAWSADGSIQVGELHDAEAQQVRAGREHGLDYRAVVLAERRAVVDDRRGRLSVLIYPTALVTLTAAPPALRPTLRRPPRRRVVLVAGEAGDLRWWDAAVSGGPLQLDELPLSSDYRERFDRVASELVEQAEHLASGLDGRGFDRMDRWMEDGALHEGVAELWTRARMELGSRWLVGCRLPGEHAIRWTDDPDDDDTEDIPF